jgi:hypothetical protein
MTPPHPTDPVAVLREFIAAWNRHDVDGIMEYFDDDSVFLGARGSSIDGERLVGLKEIRAGVESRLEAIPDARWIDDEYIPCGSDVVYSTWKLVGKTAEGESLEVRGCDLYRLRDGKVVLKDSFLKART